MKKILRNTISSAVYAAAKITRNLGRGTRVLCYHKVNNYDDEYMNVPVDLFKEQMDYLCTEGYQCVSLKDILNDELPPKSVALTFDDGYEDNYTNAVPILRDCGFSALFFCIADQVGTDKFMNENHLKELAADGFGIGSHTLSHPELNQLSRERKEREIGESKKRLEALVGSPVEYFCYPRGLYDQESLGLVEKAGYLAAVSNRPGANHYRNGKIVAERYLMRRTEISPKDSIPDFAKKMAGAFDPLHSVLHAVRGRP